MHDNNIGSLDHLTIILPSCVVNSLAVAMEAAKLASPSGVAMWEVGVLGHDAQGHLLATAADHDREGLADGRRVQRPQALHDDRHVAVQIAQA